MVEKTNAQPDGTASGRNQSKREHSSFNERTMPAHHELSLLCDFKAWGVSVKSTTSLEVRHDGLPYARIDDDR